MLTVLEVQVCEAGKLTLKEQVNLARWAMPPLLDQELGPIMDPIHVVLPLLECSAKIFFTIKAYPLRHALLHKKLANDEPWEKKGHRVTLLVEPGRLKHAGKTKLFGVPYGARARMILLYLQTQAIRTSSREVALGRSMRDWMERMGLAIGGETAHALREQAARISACSLKFFWDDAGADGFERGAIVRSGLRFHAEDSTQGSLWEDRVVLDETFYAALRDHPVPLLEAAIRQLRDRSMSLDIYVWLAWRLHGLAKTTSISWPAVTHSSAQASRQSGSSSHVSPKRYRLPSPPTLRPAWTSETRRSLCTHPGRRLPELA